MGAKEICFVIGPIGTEGSDTRTHADWLSESIIKPVMEQFPVFADTVRADKIALPGMITTQVIELLLDAKLVIADLSFFNPNAFYEIGIRHMIQKPIIHMQLKQETPPFDVTGYRAIKFSLRHPDDLSDARHELAEQVKMAIDKDYTVENPVTHARGRLKMEQASSPEQKVILDELRALSSRIARLETYDAAGDEATSFDLYVTLDDAANRAYIMKAIDETIVRQRKPYGWGKGSNPNGEIKLSITGPSHGSSSLTPTDIDRISEELRKITGVRSVLPF